MAIHSLSVLIILSHRQRMNQVTACIDIANYATVLRPPSKSRKWQCQYMLLSSSFVICIDISFAQKLDLVIWWIISSINDAQYSSSLFSNLIKFWICHRPDLLILILHYHFKIFFPHHISVNLLVLLHIIHIIIRCTRNTYIL